MPYADQARSRRRRCISAFLLAAAILGPACRRQADDSGQATTLRIGFGIGPSARATGVSTLTDILYSEPLVAHDWNGQPIAALADSWEWADNRTSVSLRLKQGVRMHDGTLLTADSVARFLQNHRDDGRLGFRYITSVAGKDGATVVIRLSRPDAFLLPELSDLRIAHPDRPDVSTGPFQVLTRTPVVEVRRFEQYHGGRSAIGGVRIVTYDTHRAAWAALLRGEVDVVQEVTRDSVEFMEHSSNVKTYSSLQPFYVYLAFNHRHPVMQHVEVRRALSQALDRQDIIDRAMRGLGRVSEGPIWPFHWAYTPLTTRYTYEPQEARRRLDQAGFTLPAPQSPGERHSRFSFKCLVWSEDPQYERIALMVQRQLFDIGVDMQIELLPLDAFIKRAVAGAFDAYLMQTNASRSLDFAYRFWRSSGSANTALQNSGYTGADTLLDAVRHSTSDDEMRVALQALARRFYEDAPAAFIAWTEVTRAVDARFSVAESAIRDPFANIWQWRPRPIEPD
jgi:peptide/nickel transport system substrate-binding protein